MLAGLVLMLLQALLIRELSASLVACELTILVVAAGFWSGMSLGYAVSPRISARALPVLAVASGVAQLLLCVVRLWPLAGLRLGFNGWGILAWIYLLTLPLPVLYSAVLPRVVDRGSPDTLMPAYRLELLGAATGLAALLVLSRFPGPWVGALYAASAIALTALLVPEPLRLVALTASIALLPVAARLHEWQTRTFFERHHHLSVHRILHSSDSPYQKIELIVDTAGQVHGFRNGMEFFNEGDLARFNWFLSELPARMTRPRRALIGGSGSMASVAHVAPYAESVTTVEIDARVVEVSRRHLGAWNRLDQVRNHRVVIDDVAHFLRRTSERFDLIILDLPPPITIRLGALYTQEFYELARSRLADGGVLCLYSGGGFMPENLLARQVVAAVAAAFRECVVIDQWSLGQLFVLAGDRLPMTASQVAAAIRAHAPDDVVRIYPRGRALAVVGSMPPLSLRRPGGILWVNQRLIEDYWVPKSRRGRAPI
jgi:spermidine synthase